jgi:hypothetical protein
MARRNMSAGPMSQFWISDSPRARLFRKTSPNFSYRTFASGGNIMMINPIAMGIFVVPIWKRLTKPAVEGMKWPMATPIAIARKIQRVRKRSKNESFLRAAGAQTRP